MLSHCPNLVAIGCKEPIIPAGYRFERPDRNWMKRSYKALKEKWRRKIQACQQYVVTKNFVNDTTSTIVALRRPKLLLRVTINLMESCQIWPLLSGHLYWGEVVTVQNSRLAIFTVFHLYWAVSSFKQKRLSLNFNFLTSNCNWSSGWKRAWEGLLMLTDVSASWAEVLVRVKWSFEIQTNVVMPWSVLWFVVGRVMWCEMKMVSSDWRISIRFVSEGRSRR